MTLDAVHLQQRLNFYASRVGQPSCALARAATPRTKTKTSAECRLRIISLASAESSRIGN
jgi:hypothetical protein